MPRPTRTTALLALVAALLAGCARPGELGTPQPEPAVAAAAPAPAPSAAPAPAPPSGPVILGSGRIEDRVSISTPGPAVFSVRTVVLAPGADTGWHRHPGYETSIVKSGSVTLVKKGACKPVRYKEGDAVFIADGVPHLAVNDGDVPAELVVTYLLAPDADPREDVEPACPAR